MKKTLIAELLASAACGTMDEPVAGETLTPPSEDRWVEQEEEEEEEQEEEVCATDCQLDALLAGDMFTQAITNIADNGPELFASQGGCCLHDGNGTPYATYTVEQYSVGRPQIDMVVDDLFIAGRIFVPVQKEGRNYRRVDDRRLYGRVRVTRVENWWFSTLLSPEIDRLCDFDFAVGEDGFTGHFCGFSLEKEAL